MIREPFRPPWWGRNRHVQTIWGPLLRPVRLSLRRERFETRDGDFVDLDWDAGAPADPEAPALLVLHGLEGSSRSHYAAGFLREARSRGWRGAVFHFRSCSGPLNRRPRFYHSGDWGDVEEVVGRVAAREPRTPIGLVGVSLGGNVVLKWLGERPAAVPDAVIGAVAVSTPYDLVASARTLDRGFAREVYTRNFLRTMRAKVVEKARRYPGFVDVAAARRARTFAEYDRAVTAPLEGFADEVDYWTRASSGPWLARIRRPTLLLNARDDPLVPASTLPDPARLPPTVTAEYTERGGHAGFLEGRWPLGGVRSWAERRAVEFLTARLPAAGRAGTTGRGPGRRGRPAPGSDAPGIAEPSLAAGKRP